MMLIRDPRTLGWPIAGNVQAIICLLGAYVLLGTVVGPRVMRSKAPFNIQYLIMIHNAAMVLLNAYFLVKFVTRSYLGGGYSLWCQGIDFQSDSVTMELIGLCYGYFWVRVSDFADTFFFCMRKKESHITMLHVVHHCLVVFNGWFGLTYGADGQVMFSLCLNSFVHIFMYTYYFLSLCGPRLRPYLGWKRYLTLLQMAQFVAIFAHSTIPLYTECGYPKIHSSIIVTESILFFVMFVQFYTRAYARQKLERCYANGTHNCHSSNGSTVSKSSVRSRHSYETRLQSNHR